jgi:hypothetical protein
MVRDEFLKIAILAVNYFKAEFRDAINYEKS